MNSGVDTRHASITWLQFPEQFDPKSPWSDKRVRLAANYAMDRQAINEAACPGFCPPTAVIIPRVMFAPILDFRALMGIGPRVAEHTINSIPVHPFPALEDIRLK
jgi:ABC-type oligopeptide transport system substrate-binding subunit